MWSAPAAEELSATRFANRFCFLNRGNNTVHSRFFGKLRQLHNECFRYAADSDFFHRFVVHARQKSHGEQARSIGSHRDSGADGLHGRLEHGLSAERVDVEKLDASHRRRRKHRSGNCVWNVVEFQIEKDARP